MKLRWLATLLALAAAAWLAPARADIYGYVDERGVAHFAAEKLDQRYELFFRGGQSFDTGSGLAALESVRRQSPDIAIVDVGLPDIDGWEVARRIRLQAPVPRPVMVAITGFGQPEDRERSREAGFDVHLTKPVDPASLLNVLGGVTVQGGAAA